MGPEVDYYLCFTATLRTSKLTLPPIYSNYQQFLHDTVVEFHEKGWTFNRIAEWSNENGYKIPYVKGSEKDVYVHSVGWFSLG